MNVLELSKTIDYVSVVSKEKSILVLDSLKKWIEKLQNLNFVQVNRSYIINVDKVQKVSGNRCFIDDKAIPIGKTYKHDFLEKLSRL